MDRLVERLLKQEALSDLELANLIDQPEAGPALSQAADQVRQRVYGKKVFLRGLIEVSNYCKNNCHYCGLRRDHAQLKRYRLSERDILECCKEGYRLGFRTFVLQGGEDPWFRDERLVPLVQTIKRSFPDCALTLSLGERSQESYAALCQAGADRYLLRHESANPDLYQALHPPEMALDKRMTCLTQLKSLGYQVGAGFMVDAPGQTTAHLVQDLRYLQALQPAMVGVGPFLSHQATPYKDEPNGDLEKTLRLVALVRLLLPHALIPATTALSTLHPQGRIFGLQAGANVLMPNLSPMKVRSLYTLYDHKQHTEEESAQQIHKLKVLVEACGYELTIDRGDVIMPQTERRG